MDFGRRKSLMRVVIVVHRQADLLQIVAATHAASRFAGSLHGGQQ
jgi:hypothetical protein